VLAMNLEPRVLVCIFWRLVAEDADPTVPTKRCLFLEMPAGGGLGRLWYLRKVLLLQQHVLLLTSFSVVLTNLFNA
jgi:hypothetical protein